jgi:hypothetical protein
MLIYGAEDDWTALSPAEVNDVMEQIQAWFERWEPAGKIHDSGAELQGADTARTVRVGADGHPVVTDGPYLELKEVIGGVFQLECADLDEAAAIAATWPLTGIGGVEVRPVRVRTPVPPTDRSGS